ncbi:MAG: anti-sigma factor antagonist [Clostridia bacterium]|nr:anti-sigma factor antagonist [Clostridia bacterium]
MLIKFKKEKETLTAYLEGEIDHHTAAFARNEIDTELMGGTPAKLILDFGGVTFMDSSGIGLVMGRYKTANSINAALEVSNIPQNIYKLMKLAGLEKLAELKRKD